MKKEGVIYISCNSHRHYKEAIKSASSVLEYNPDIDITLLTDSAQRELGQINYKQFHSPVHHPLKEKCKMMRESPYDKTLFLDTDTKIMGDISPIFNYLDDYDLAVANAPNVDSEQERFSEDFFVSYKIPNIYNTGVVGFRNNGRVNDFFELWWNRFKQIPNFKISTGHGDQIYFNKILNDDSVDTSYLRIKELDNKKYNARSVIVPYLKKDGLLSDVVIYHGHKDWSEVS